MYAATNITLVLNTTGETVQTKPDTKLGAEFVRPHELFEQLKADVITAYELLDEQRDSQFLRRAAVRAIFALIEASIEIIKSELRSTLRFKTDKDQLSEKELIALGGLSTTPNPKTQNSKVFTPRR